MQETEVLTNQSCCDPEEDCDAIRQFKSDLAEGKNWFRALLEAIRVWDRLEEEHGDRTYRYLIGNEAFDWLVLAERLLHAVDGLVPEQEKEALLFLNKPPIEISEEEFKDLIGPAKYRAYLNYLYGVVVEESLMAAVEREMNKEQLTRIYSADPRFYEDLHQRIYGATQEDLLGKFREENGLTGGNRISLVEMKEFTYWLFKYRLRRCHKARIASDTRKGLLELQQQRLLIDLPRKETCEDMTDYIEARAYYSSED